MAGVLSPVPDGTDVGEPIGGKFYGRNLLNDTAGADAMGLVASAPDANTLLGRLKAIADAITSRLPTLGAKAASGSVSVVAASDGFSVTDVAGAPASSGSAITPHDTNALGTVTRAIYVGTAGNITLRFSGASADTVLKNVPAGILLPVKASHVRATGTTASDLVGLA